MNMSGHSVYFHHDNGTSAGQQLIESVGANFHKLHVSKVSPVYHCHDNQAFAGQQLNSEQKHSKVTIWTLAKWGCPN